MSLSAHSHDSNELRKRSSFASVAGRKRSRIEVYDISYGKPPAEDGSSVEMYSPSTSRSETTVTMGSASSVNDRSPVLFHDEGFTAEAGRLDLGCFSSSTNYDLNTSWQNSSPNPSQHQDIFSGDNNIHEQPGVTVDSSDSATWGRYMLSVVGDLAGKVLDLCWTSAFQGFKAGGGMVYQFKAGSAGELEVSPPTHDFANTTPIMPHIHSLTESHPDTSPDHDPADLRPSKRLHTNHDGGWVVVNRAAQASPQPPRSASIASPRSQIPRPSTHRPSATYRSHATPTFSSPLAPTSDSPNKPRRFASVASPRSPAHFIQNHHSPASRTPSRIPQQVPLESADWTPDASMRRLNQQLQAMISEGTAALASKPEVMDDTSDNEAAEIYDSSIHEDRPPPY